MRREQFQDFKKLQEFRLAIVRYYNRKKEKKREKNIKNKRKQKTENKTQKNINVKKSVTNRRNMYF